MKLKKYVYLITLIIMLSIGINGVEADVTKTCYYKEETNGALIRLDIKDGGWTEKSYAEAFVNKFGMKLDNDSEPILNWYSDHKDKVTGMTLNRINKDKKAAKQSTTCPSYLIGRTNDGYSSYAVFASNSKTIAQQLTEKSNAVDGYQAWYLSYKSESGQEYTSEEYFDTFVTPDNITDLNATITCDELFGDKKDDGDKNDVNRDGTASISYMVDSILDYVRVIVPILIIVLGVFDLAKAVIAGKEDEMRKSQLTFIKRLILGVVVFFVPLVVDVVMNLADLVWEASGYSSCEFR